MSKFIKLYVSKSKHVLFRYGDNRKWRYYQNWACGFTLAGRPNKVLFYSVIMPFLRITKCNGKFEIGLGNHYLEFGF